MLRRVSVVMVGLAVIGVLTAGPASAGGSKATKACTQALNAAEALASVDHATLLSQQDAQQQILKTLTSSPTFAIALNGVTPIVTQLAEDTRIAAATRGPIQDRYDSAAKRCRAGK